MEIQRLSTEEWARFQAIRLASLRDSPGAFGSTLASAETRTETDWRKQLEETATFVAAHEGTDVGVVRGAVDQSDPSTAFLISMWVAPDHRGMGIGGQLVRTVIDWARSAGLDQLVLDVADDNVVAIELYARNGFEPTGEVGTLPPPRIHVREHRRALVL